MMMRLCTALLFAIPALLQAQGLQALDDLSLSKIHGREGIAMDLQLDINTDADGNPLSSLGGCTALNSPCRMAFLFHNRNSGGGEWVTWKNFFGQLKLNNLWIDADQTPSTASGFQDDRANNRFMSGDGSTCLLDGSAKTTDCHTAALDMPMLALQFNEGMDKGLELYMHLGGVAIEYGATGYSQDAFKPALGVLIGDVRGTDLLSPTAHPAEIKIGGTMGLYGF